METRARVYNSDITLRAASVVIGTKRGVPCALVNREINMVAMSATGFRHAWGGFAECHPAFGNDVRLVASNTWRVHALRIAADHAVLIRPACCTILVPSTLR